MGRKTKKNTTLQSKIQEITELLKAKGLYREEFAMQVKLVAQLSIKTDLIFAKTMEDDYLPVVKQTSREGHSRETINGYELLFKQYTEQLQTALRGLGLNTDSKKVERTDDNFDAFYEDLNKVED